MLAHLQWVLNVSPIADRPRKEKKKEGGGEAVSSYDVSSCDVNTEDSRYWQHGVKNIKRREEKEKAERKVSEYGGVPYRASRLATHTSSECLHSS